ncbi:hypothetical protein N9R79_00470 [Vibrio sp.]|nr:hypothetical protein [Vibrio sp.]
MSQENTIPKNETEVLSFTNTCIVLAVFSVVSLLSNWAGTGVNMLEALPGMLILFVVIILSIGVKQIVPVKLPVVAWVSLISILITIPIFPYAALVLEYVGKINFISMVTPVLAYAAVSISRKEIDLFKRSGFKIMLVALLVFTGTFLGSVFVADLLL